MSKITTEQSKPVKQVSLAIKVIKMINQILYYKYRKSEV